MSEIMESNNLVKVEQQEGLTTISIGTVGPLFNIQKTEVRKYRETAREFLDLMSKDFNSIGIDSIIGALIYENVVMRYNGKHSK